MNRFTNTIIRLIIIQFLMGISAMPARAEVLLSKDDVKQIIVDMSSSSERIPVWVALAVAEVSSDFSVNMKGTSGAIGVMQIQPSVAMREIGVNPEDLWDPEVNIWAGINYLEKLHHRYDGRWEAILSHYNGGELQGMAYSAKPHRSNRNFVKQVLNLALDYQLDGYPSPTSRVSLKNQHDYVLRYNHSNRFTYEVHDADHYRGETHGYHWANNATHFKNLNLRSSVPGWQRGDYWIRTPEGVIYSDELLPPATVGRDSKVWLGRLRSAFRAELAERELPWFTERVRPITE